jgi:hypothetical protein
MAMKLQLTGRQSQRDFDFDYNSGKLQSRPLVREDTTHQQTRNFLAIIKIQSRVRMGAWDQDKLAYWTLVVA